ERGSVTAALETLNRDMPDGDCYIIFSASCLRHFLLYRHGSHNKVMERLAESLQSASAPKEERATTQERLQKLQNEAEIPADLRALQKQILQAEQRTTLEAQRAETLSTELQAAKREIAELRSRVRQQQPPAPPAPIKKVDLCSFKKDLGYLGSMSVRTQGDLPNLCMAGMHDDNEWAVEWAIAMGPCQPDAADLHGAIFLDPKSVTSLRAAVAKLLTGELVCHGDLAVAWSDSAMGYQLLYRRGCKKRAQQLVCLLAEHLSSSKAGLLLELARTTAWPSRSLSLRDGI
ncbi:unnamed protein product, partial [Polarella glacialis]